MRPDAGLVISAARRAGVTLAVAESLTGGAVAAALTGISGASDVFLGGVVAYQAEVKRAVLGVPEAMLAGPGPVSEEVARAMARGVRDLLGADVAVATTGVAGPSSHGGKPPGTVCIAAVSADGAVSRTVRIAGGRLEVIAGAVAEALSALVTIVTRPPLGGTSVE